jgi:elongation factor P hydroxylase
MGRGIVVQQEPSALCWNLWPHLGKALQQSSDNLNVENTIDSLPFRHNIFMNHNLFLKKCGHHGFGLGLL